MRILMSLAAISVISGCASTTGRAYDPGAWLEITTPVPGAEVTTSAGHSCITPCTIGAPSGSELDITVTRDGTSETATVAAGGETYTVEEARTFAIVDAVSLGGLSAAIDRVSMGDPTPRQVPVEFGGGS